MEFEPGQILDDGKLILYGKKTFVRYNVYATLIEDYDSIEPSMIYSLKDKEQYRKFYTEESTITQKYINFLCPSCGKGIYDWTLVMSVMPAPRSHGSACALVCNDCKIAFRSIYIGYIDEDGDYHEYDGSNRMEVA